METSHSAEGIVSHADPLGPPTAAAVWLLPRAAASFLLRRPGWGVAEYLAELRGRGIAALDKFEAVLGLSLDRLADEDGELARRFALLGAFPAGFDAAAAAAVWRIE